MKIKDLRPADRVKLFDNIEYMVTKRETIISLKTADELALNKAIYYGKAIFRKGKKIASRNKEYHEWKVFN